MINSDQILIAQILFWCCVAAIFHSYVLFPLLLKILAKNKTFNEKSYELNDELPKISILMAVFNEETVIFEKINTIVNTEYPAEKIEIIIGSDNSTDNTNAILDDLAVLNSNIIFKKFMKRQGKGNIINQLSEIVKGEIIILTDANVMFDKHTLFELVRYFKNYEIGLVDTHMLNKGMKREGISIQESAYISREVIIKHNESKIWGTMMGPFGGCYAIRKELYVKVPHNFLVDDFFINMNILMKGKKAVNNTRALVYEDVSNNLWEEFRRKIRISTGNFQNLFYFGKNIFLPGKQKNKKLRGLTFTFFSHKILRWFSPFLIIISLISNICLFNIPFYRYILYAYCFSFCIPFIDAFFKKCNLHVVFLRFITHFYSMNIALLIGFFNYLKGVNTNVWQPTQRFQK